MNKKIITVIIILISLSCLSCVWANDLNDSTLNQEDIQVLELEDDATEVLSSQDSEESNLTSAGSSNDENPSTYLVLDNDADKENIYIGDWVTWNIEVYNSGPNDAKNVKVFDQLPEGLKYIKHTASQGTFNPDTGIWDIGDLPKYATAFLDIVTEAITPGEKISKANLTSDTVNLNNDTYEEEEIDVFLPKQHDSVKSQLNHSKIRATGNPLILILISLVCCFAFRFKVR
ncbi:DUF11 domain-containing protein [Methanobrevibacter sp.]|uniref:DUF11 domain-containing protein n=1 Tax=Methanobrevibacter sp. TaxID=66852 RepID=UPI00389019B9